MSMSKDIGALIKLGDGLTIVAMLVWLSVSVGPWWLGLLIFVVAWVVNTIQVMWGEE